jgi:hypothetical protein
MFDGKADQTQGQRHLGNASEADAWWAYGSRAQLLSDGSLRFGSGVAGGRSVRLTLDQVDRPIAVSEPLACPAFEPAWRFTLNELASMRRTLDNMEAWLSPTVVQLRLAAMLVEQETRMSSRFYHVVAGAKLVAVVDRMGAVGVAPNVAPADLLTAVCVARPASAGFIPETFVRSTIWELVWRYATKWLRPEPGALLEIPERRRLVGE